MRRPLPSIASGLNLNLTQTTRALVLLVVGAVVGRMSSPATTTVVHLSSGPTWTDSAPASWSSTLYDREEVTSGKPSPVGKGSFRFEDARGGYERREFPLEDVGNGNGNGNDHLYVNVLFTKAGHFRSGDIHMCHQVNQIVSGRARVTMVHPRKAGGFLKSFLKSPRTRGSAGVGKSRFGGAPGVGVGGGERETVTELVTGDQIVIPPHVPHLYEFLEDTLMTESWVHGENRTQCAFKAWFYQPLRRRIPVDTQRSVFTSSSSLL